MRDRIRREAPIQQEVCFAHPRDAVFNLLTSENAFRAISGGASTYLDPQVGGHFSFFGGAIVGTTLENVANKRLVQAWRAKSWSSAQASSTVRIELKTVGFAKTLLSLRQSDFPYGEMQTLEQAWELIYWTPMRAYLSGQCVTSPSNEPASNVYQIKRAAPENYRTRM